MEGCRAAVDTCAATAATNICFECALKLAHCLAHAQIADVFDDMCHSLGLGLSHY